MLKAVIFDVDGVIIKYKLFSDRYIEKYKIPEKVMVDFFMGEFNEIVTGKKDLKKVLPNYLLLWQWKGTVDELINYWLSEDIVDEKVIQLIKQLNQKGIKTYIASNQEKYRSEYLINKLEFGKVFKNYYFSHSLGFQKPETEFFNELFNLLKRQIDNLKMNEVLLVDDEEKNILAAKKIGFKTHFYKNSVDLEKEIVPYIT